MNKKKLNIAFVKSSFASKNYILLENEYINNSTKMNYICPDGHEHSITWGNWIHGVGCPYCAKCAIYTYDNILSAFEKENYILLSKEYINNMSYLYYTCPKGHNGNTKWHAWNILGQRCKMCYNDSKRIDFELIKNSFMVAGYLLLSDKYVDSNALLDYECSLGHIHKITRGHWSQGVRCPTCHNLSRFGSGHPNWQGGISYEPYCPIWKDKEYKHDIRERDGNRCLNPYCDSKKSNDLVIHHIDYNKKNCGPNNLITVCRSCNFKANIDREWHTAWYNAIIYNRYKRSK